MNNRNWRVGSLEEFLPDQANLLGINVNHGQKICIRLRPHYNQSRFYDFDHLIETMLHELTHIKFGPHDSSFYNLLDELNDEYDVLLTQGFTGGGFFSDGKRVGEGISHNVSPALARQKALEAAEKRRKTERIMTNGGRRLGGSSGGYGLPTRELAAMAAERRTRDNFWCGSEQNRSGIKKPTVGSTTTRPDVKATTSKSSPIGSQPLDNGTSSYLPEPVIKKPTVGSTTTRPNVKATTSKSSPIGSQWTCSQCTFINRPMASQCDVCLTERPPDNDTSSYLPEPDVDDLISDAFHWDCPKCTFRNTPDIIICLGCDYLKN
ncbi:WLM-domain-containing protein [Rhizophagus irregularis]|uniref:WLM-domain-containing protein n=1 Tax=Rhizophagus irregularis TaxID=588596 RepID=A0A2N0SIV7_9GLOM|nr:WLM-domain-containing protein [Rhizophagus irregularis]